MASEKRLIDANALKEYLNSLEASGGHKYYRKGVDDTLHVHIPNIVDEQSTVDAVKVVRCKDCENRVYVDNGDEIGEIGGCKLFKMAMPYDSFCSYGKRRSTENV